MVNSGRITEKKSASKKFLEGIGDFFIYTGREDGTVPAIFFSELVDGNGPVA